MDDKKFMCGNGLVILHYPSRWRRLTYGWTIAMLKKIDSSQLRVGMAIHDLDCGWMEHPFVRAKFVLSTDDEIRKITRAGIRNVVIDCSKGIDVESAPTLEEARAKTEEELTVIASKPVKQVRTSLGEEMQRAVGIRRQAVNVVRTVMQDARLGKAVEMENVSPVVQNITESILRNNGALLSLMRIKTKDDYTFLHSVSVCTLLVAFCRSRGMDEDTIYEAGIGGLLHDTGKALVPDSILNKPGRLTDEEFAIIKKHPRDGYDILRQTPEIGQIPLDITLHHHERRDGSGYPEMQNEGEISELAQMAAIVDVYDAITSDRSYHKGMPAAEALRKIYEWSKFHFNPTLTQDPAAHHAWKRTIADGGREDCLPLLHKHIRHTRTGKMSVPREEEGILKPGRDSGAHGNNIVRIG